MESAELNCPKCQRLLKERQLKLATLTAEFCPHCSTEIRRNEGMRWTDLDQIATEAIGGVDALLSMRSPQPATSKPTERGQLWTVEHESRVYEIEYNPLDAKYIVSISSLRTALPTAAQAEPLFGVCEKLGVHFDYSKQTQINLQTGVQADRRDWQVFSLARVRFLSNDFLNTVFSQLAKAAAAVESHLAGS